MSVCHYPCDMCKHVLNCEVLVPFPGPSPRGPMWASSLPAAHVWDRAGEGQPLPWSKWGHAHSQKAGLLSSGNNSNQNRAETCSLPEVVLLEGPAGEGLTLVWLRGSQPRDSCWCQLLECRKTSAVCTFTGCHCVYESEGSVTTEVC